MFHSTSVSARYFWYIENRKKDGYISMVLTSPQNILTYRKLATAFCLIIFFHAKAFALPPINQENPENARSKILNQAQKYLGVPYKYGGVSTSGMDCSGFVYMVFQNALNVSIPRTTYGLYTWAEKISTEELQPGDLVFFNTTGTVSHVGIFTGKRRFIHSASDGPKTGVIYSSLDESYWSRCYIGAGRALSKINGVELSSVPETGTGTPEEPGISMPVRERKSNFSIGVGGAVSWNNYINESDVLRGVGFQLGTYYKLPIEGKNFRLGLELRPGWDITLGVFRLPITFSFGNDWFKVFFGPAISVGDPSLDTPAGVRFFNGGSSWAGEAGLTISPLNIKAGEGKISLFAELAWQFYYPAPGQSSDWMANLSAASRISTGFRYTWDI